MNRRHVLIAVLAVAVVSAGIGWLAGQQIKSPAEVAAETAPPDPSTITVSVEQRELVSQVVLRGTVTSSGSTDIVVTAATDGAALVTRLPVAVGDTLTEGDVALEVAGRPVLVIQGELPAYRTLAPGMEGPDVRQLEMALNRMGYDPGEVDDVYTVSTGVAVAALYKDAGYKANEPSLEELDLVEAAEDRVSEAQKELDTAQRSTTTGGLSKSESIRLDLEITHAEEALSDAKAAKGNGLAEQKAAKTAADRTYKEASDALDAARGRLDKAEKGTHPDTGKAPTDGELEELRAAVSEAETVQSDAKVAKDAADSAFNGGAVELDRNIRDAEKQLEIAKASKTEAIASANTAEDSPGGDITALQQNLNDANDDLARARAVTGVSLPAAEFRFVKTLPSTVQAVNVELGETPGGAALSITGESTVLESSVASGDNELLEVGIEGMADEVNEGISFPVRISKLAAEPSGGDSAGERYSLVLEPIGDVPAEAMGQSMRITIPISSTGGEVLAVPLAAVSAGASGEARVEVENPTDGSTRLVEVATGLSADGYVEIRPSSAGAVEAGDQVVVGRDLFLPDTEGAGEESDAVADGDSES